MREKALIMVLLVLCAGFESVFETTWKKELILGIVFLLGMWEDRLLFRREEGLLNRLEELASRGPSRSRGD